MSLAAGAKLDGYEILSLLGAGGMGEVYRARDPALKRDVAIKVLPAFVAQDSERLGRFKQEAQAAAALNHPNILAVFGLGTFGGAPYLVSELLEGETLRQILRHGAVAIRKATDYAAQVAHGLAAAHERGIVHRDLKPENLFVTKGGRVKILDFGLAKLQQPVAESDDAPTRTFVTNPGVVMGTVGYMSPEQVRGRPIDFRADIFALGAVLYEMLTGKQAFARPTAAETMTAILNEDPPSLSQSGKNISPGLQRVILRCLEKKPEQRFQSASDLAFALEALSDPSDSGAVAIAPVRRSPWLWILFATCALAVDAAVILWLRLPPAVPVVESITQITDDGEPKFAPNTDGTRIYFNEGAAGATHIAQVSVTGGRTALVEGAPTNYWITGITPDGGEMLLRSLDSHVMDTSGGQLRKIADRAVNPEWSPDGTMVAVTSDGTCLVNLATPARCLV
jgi:serine/threonine protein kinase